MHLAMGVNTFPISILTSIATAASPQLRELNVYVPVQGEQPALAEAELAAYTQLDTALTKPALNGMKLVVCLFDSGASVEAVDRWQRKLVHQLPKFCSAQGRLVVKRVPSGFPLHR